MRTTSATPDAIRSWGEINFSRAKKSVKKLQRRIATAVSNNDFEKATILQHQMVHSFYAKALAVKAVTSKKGKNTAGVDGVIWRTPEDKFNAISSLSRRGYKYSPLRRIYVPKADGGMRAISIPTMKDRALQTLHKFALEPIEEVTADENSFGFRPGRNAGQAIQRLIEILSHEPYPEWILKTDVKSFFDNIRQDWVMKHIPMDKSVLHGLLSSGYIYSSIYYGTDDGISEGGSLSNVVSNMVMDGLADVLYTSGGCYTSGDHYTSGSHGIDMIRYADDIVIVSDNQLFLWGAANRVSHFLAERGLSLSQEKTRIHNVKDGITFLGYEVHKDNGVVYAVPSKRGIDSVLSKVKKLVTFWPVYEDDSKKIKECSNSLKSIIGGWLTCYRGTATTESLFEIRDKIVLEVAKLAGRAGHPVANQVLKIFDKLMKEDQ